MLITVTLLLKVRLSSLIGGEWTRKRKIWKVGLVRTVQKKSDLLPQVLTLSK